MSRLPLSALLLFLIATLAPLEQVSAADPSLKLLWSKPVAAGYRAPGIVLSNHIEGSGSLIGFYATGGLLTAPDENGPGPTIPLHDLKEKRRIILAVARDQENTFWLGGRSNQQSYFPGHDTSNAYLARVDSQGRVIKEHEFKSWFSFRQIQELLPLDTGEIAVAENNQLAKIASNGRVLWEKKLNPNKAIALSQIGTQIVLATIEQGAKNHKGHYRDDVVVRFIGIDGKTNVERVIRAGINDEPGSHYGNLQISQSDDAVYVSSNWVDILGARPIEVSKTSLKGEIAWQTKIAPSVLQNTNKTWESCKPKQTILTNGNLLSVCAINGEISTYQLSSKTGALKVNSVALPECHKNGIANLFLVQRKNGAIWLFGSRPGNNVAASCTWLAELKLE